MNIAEFLNQFKDYTPEECELIGRAYSYAYRAHRNQPRKSGEPYIIHPRQVASYLALMGADANTICAALLHDTIEDDINTDKQKLIDFFNPTVANLVDGVTKMKKCYFDNNKELAAMYNNRKLIESITSDIRVFIIKLADRLHNMQTLEFKSEESQKRIANETLKLYVPFADLLGENEIKTQLQELSFKYIDRQLYEETTSYLDEIKKEYSPSIEETLLTVWRALKEKKISFDYTWYTKNKYYLAKDLMNSKKVDEIDDLFLVNIVVDNDDQCLEVKNIIEKIFKKIKEKDYMSNQKNNLYSAVHTTVYGANDLVFQFHITTKERDYINKYGITAFWKILNDNINNPSSKLQDKIRDFQFYKLLTVIESLKLTDDEFIKVINKDLLSKMIHIKYYDEIVELPENSCLIDLIYKKEFFNLKIIQYGIIKDENGNETKKNLREKLHDNEEVKFVYNHNMNGPFEDYYNLVETELAKALIKKQN